jgi:hypothetical protein
MIKQDSVLFLLLLVTISLQDGNVTSILWDQFLFINETVYNLRLFNDGNDAIATPNSILNLTGAAATFRLSSYISKGCATEKTYAVLNVAGVCSALTGDASLNSHNFTEYHTDSIYTVQIAYPPIGAVQLFINTTCDRTGTVNTSVITYDILNPTVFMLNVTSKTVCPIATNIKSFWFYFEQYRIIFAIVFWVVGLFMVFFGIWVFRVIMFLIGFMITSLGLDVMMLYRSSLTNL